LSAIFPHPERKLIVSFHDLHPDTMKCCVRFLRRLERMGVPGVSLLVVPNWYHQAPIYKYPEFSQWLEALHHDISLHGYAHQASHRPKNWLEWLMANAYTAAEGEFYKLPPAAAELLITQGLELFRQAGIKANGFIAPAWLMEEEHLPILGRADLDYSVTFRKIYDLEQQYALRAPVLCTTSRTWLRRGVTRQVVSMLAKKHEREQVLRIAVHPVDFQCPKIECFMYQLIEQCLAGRKPTTYRELIAHERLERAGKNQAAEQQIKMVGKKTP
jgi:predicted deacetylase